MKLLTYPAVVYAVELPNSFESLSGSIRRTGSIQSMHELCLSTLASRRSLAGAVVRVQRMNVLTG